jgi:hypothetical protein
VKLAEWGRHWICVPIWTITHEMANVVKDIIPRCGIWRTPKCRASPDAKLEGRILEAAYRIWHARGEEALTIRRVARCRARQTRLANRQIEYSLLIGISLALPAHFMPE